MIYVRKEHRRFPFSKGILARSIAPTGLPLDRVYAIVRSVLQRLEEQEIQEIDSKDLREMVCEELRRRGYHDVEEYYLVSRELAQLTKPVVILVGGASGVGKSAVAAELGRRFGIDRIIGTDAIREIMRFMVPPGLIPVLHESSFTAANAVTESLVEDPLLYGFGQQAALVSQGVRAYIDRTQKEGLNAVINGVHLVPGLGDLPCQSEDMHLFRYIVHLEDREAHMQRFHLRAGSSPRNPERYTDRIEEIRRIQAYVRSMGQEHGVMLVENNDFDNTVRVIVDDIVQAVRKEISL
jgi:2-phosphoglycerate kinase